MPEILEGPPALSEFRRQALLDRCREICPAIGGLSVNLLYMVGFLEAPDGELRQRLRQVLAVGDDFPPPPLPPSTSDTVFWDLFKSRDETNFFV